MNDVDIIIYWVDGSDSHWLEEYNKYKGISNTRARFRDLGVLKYVFRGIDKFLPWVRKVHFITNGQLPNWLDIDSERLHYHTHKEIFYDVSDLPVFNSSAIEANFSNIEGLSEKFIIFNDDTLVLKSADESRFFIDSKPVDYLKFSFPRSGWLYEKIKPQNALACKFITNSISLINDIEFRELDKKFLFSKHYKFTTKFNNALYMLAKRIYWIEIYHQPQPHLKSTWLKLKDLYCDEISRTSKSKFRNESDINQYLYRFYNLLAGEFVPKEYDDHSSYYLKNLDSFKNEMDFLFYDNTFLCISEDENISDDDFEIIKNILTHKLEQLFSHKSTFEI